MPSGYEGGNVSRSVADDLTYGRAEEVIAPLRSRDRHGGPVGHRLRQDIRWRVLVALRYDDDLRPGITTENGVVQHRGRWRQEEPPHHPAIVDAGSHARAERVADHDDRDVRPPDPSAVD